jgi:hypothetical protein
MSRTGVLFVAIMFAVLPNRMASAQWCPIDLVGSFDGSCWSGPQGVINIDDNVALIQEVNGSFAGYCDGTPTVEIMDLNCDGQVNGLDADVFLCIDTGGSDLDCCPNCDPALTVPAVSTWGMVALMLLVMVAGTVVLRRTFVRPTA